MKKFSLKFALVIAITAILLIGLLDSPALSKRLVKDPVKNFIRQCSLYPKIKYKNLVLVPVRAPEVSSNVSILTLDEALKQDVLIIKEVSESGQVNTLAMWNKGKQNVFIMAGEILAGSKQDRVLKEDVILPPKSGKVLVKVYCVEHGRWTYKSKQFYSEKKAANISVRQTARAGKSQSMVWNDVARTNRALEADAKTESLSKSHEAPVIRRNREKYVGQFADIPSKYPKANGVIVLVNGKVMVCDLFSSRTVFKKIWKKMLDSYIIEAISRRDSDVPSDFDSASDFLNEVEQATISYTPSPGMGQNVEITSSTIAGAGIIKNSLPYHLDIFPTLKETDTEPTSPGIRRDYNRVPQQQQQQVIPQQEN